MNRKRRRGYDAEVITGPFKGIGAYPVAVVLIDGAEYRLFCAPEGRWKVR